MSTLKFLATLTKLTVIAAMAAVDYGYRRGIDTPTWEWLAPFPQGISYHGCSNTYDGKRYIYWVAQTGTTATTASTTTLWRYCTWTDSWHFLATVTSGNRGIDIEYDPIRNCLYLIHGAALTSWTVFNLNTANITVAGLSCTPFTLRTMTPVLPAAADYGASFTFPNDADVAETVWAGTIATGSTTTVLLEVDDSTKSAFQFGMEGLTVRMTSGAANGQRRTIASVQNANQLTVAPAFSVAPAAGDTYVIEPTNGTATSGTTTTLTDTASSWIVNQYANHDVIIESGTGAGQRRRITSNTATALTLAAAVTGNANTGPFTTAPAAGSVYKIVPSDDYLYYQPGSTSNTFWRLDLSATAPAWEARTAPPAAAGGGANTMFPGSMAPSTILCFRGAATGTFYQYDIGTNTWATLVNYGLANTITTGGAAAMISGLRRILLHQEASVRLLVANLATQQIEPFGTMPYANPASYDGKRLRAIKTADGARFIYIMRAGGQEFFRVAVEWV